MKDLHTIKKKIEGHIFEFTVHSVIFEKLKDSRKNKLRAKSSFLAETAEL